MELRIAAAWRALNKLSSEEAIKTADEILNRGVYSDALALLICQEPKWSDVGPLFERVLKEQGIEPFDRASAVRVLAKHIARRITTGETTPYEGARMIWWELAWEPDADKLLLSFIGLASEWEDHPELRPTYDADIIQAARELVEDGCGKEDDAVGRPVE